MINFPFLPVEGLHEFNLDWFLNKFKELSEEWDETKAAWLALKEYVETFFDDLDVQEEINNKLDEMLANGEIGALVSNIIGNSAFPVFVDSVDEMTNSGRIYVLTSTGYIYTYKNGAFQSTGLTYNEGTNAVTASRIHIKNDNVNIYNDYNNLEVNKIYVVDANANALMINKIPVDSNYILQTYSYSPVADTGNIQIAYSHNGKYIFHREKWGTDWTDWKKLSEPNRITTTDVIGSDANDFQNDTVIFISDGVTEENIANLPVYGRPAVIITYLSEGGSAGVQIFKTVRSEYHRVKWNTWNDWIKTSIDGEILSNTNYNIFNDFNTFVPSTIHNLPSNATESNVANAPIYGKQLIVETLGNVNSVNANNSIGAQIAISQEGDLYTRQKYNSSYTAWRKQGFSGSSKIINNANLVIAPYDNANTFPINETISVSLSDNLIENLPIYGTAIIITTVGYSPNSAIGKMQLCSVRQTGDVFIRNSYGVSQWTNWVHLTHSFYTGTCVDRTKKLTSNSKIVSFGDSLGTTVGGGSTIPSYIASQVGCTQKGYNIGGARFDETYTSNNIITQVNSATADNDVTHVFIFGGTNDAYHKTIIDTLISSVQNVIDGVKAKFPNANITYISPFTRGVFATGSHDYYAGIIQTVFIDNECDFISCLDIPLNPNLKIPNIESFFNDDTHPKEKGKKVVAKFIRQYYL